jgi:hypothetical protein
MRAMAITPGPSRYVPSAIGTAASRRGHASASTLPSSATGPRIAPLDRDVLELSGPDAQKFLKGLSCKDVESTGGGYSGFMNASVCSTAESAGRPSVPEHAERQLGSGAAHDFHPPERTPAVPDLAPVIARPSCTPSKASCPLSPPVQGQDQGRHGRLGSLVSLGRGRRRTFTASDMETG